MKIFYLIVLFLIIAILLYAFLYSMHSLYITIRTELGKKIILCKGAYYQIAGPDNSPKMILLNKQGGLILDDIIFLKKYWANCYAYANQGIYIINRITGKKQYYNDINDLPYNEKLKMCKFLKQYHRYNKDKD